MGSMSRCGGLYLIAGDVVTWGRRIDERRRAGGEQPSVNPLRQEPELAAPTEPSCPKLALFHREVYRTPAALGVLRGFVHLQPFVRRAHWAPSSNIVRRSLAAHWSGAEPARPP